MAEIALSTGDLLYDFNAFGEVTLSRGFEDHPSLEGVTIRVPSAQLATAKASLIKGANVICRIWSATPDAPTKSLLASLTMSYGSRPANC